MSNLRLLLAAIVCAVAAVSGARASTMWDEAVSGDLSNAGTSPTVVSLVAGSNILSGTTGRTNGVVDREYLTFTLPSGSKLESLTVLPGTTFLGASGLGFIALQAGNQVTVSPTGNSATGLLGWVHYGENDMGTDILGLMALGFGATGFATPLAAGSYAFWIQDTGNGRSAYQFDFNVSAVPEPSTALSLCAGMVCLAGLAGWRSSHGHR